MKELLILLSPFFWSIKNSILRFHKPFYRKTLLYTFSSVVFIILITKLLNEGMIRLENLSAEVYSIILMKGYSLIFIIVFFIQIINGIVISLNTYYQSKDLEILLASPVSRTALFVSRLFETHLKASWMLAVFGMPLVLSAGLQFNANFPYYAYSLMLFVFFSSIPVNIGIGTTIIVSGFFSARNLKKILFSIGIVALATVITLFRMFKPERFVNPELFANITLFISEIKTSSYILLPTRWISESLFDYLNENYSDVVIFTSLMVLTSYLMSILILMLFRRYHYRGWALLQEGGLIIRQSQHSDVRLFTFFNKCQFSNLFRKLFLTIDTQSRKLIKKDIIYQIRDIKNIHQILILTSLIVVYLFSITALPLNWEDIYYALKLKYLITFFNLGLILIIITSLCSRIVYPAIISEGNSLWIIKNAPITPKRYIWTKFFFFFIPIVLFGQVLTVFSSIFISITKTIFLLKIMTTVLLSASLVSMAIAFSVNDLGQSSGADAKEKLNTGSTLYMILSVLLILITLTLEIFPIFVYFLWESDEIIFIGKTWLMIGTVIFILLLVNMLATAVSIRLSIRRFDRMELR